MRVEGGIKKQDINIDLSNKEKRKEKKRRGDEMGKIRAAATNAFVAAALCCLMC